MSESSILTRLRDNSSGKNYPGKFEILDNPKLKLVHDLDLLYWMIEKKPISISSFGSLLYYKPENAPLGAPLRCTDGCPILILIPVVSS